ncbi:MAG TPA: ABC transporter permease [Nitrospiria bacterium]|nr:ABC transporter permease [Nitrospiria bacterium]
MNPTLIGFIKKELIQAVRDPRMKFILFVTPIIQMTLFGVAISNEVKNIRLAAFFDARDTVLRDVYERSIAGGWFVPAKVSGEDPFTLIQAGKADAVLVPPPGGFTRAVGRGDAPLQLLADATNVLQAQAVENYLQSILQQTVRDDLRIIPPDPPIRFDVRVLFNPSLESSIFMVPGVMSMLMLMTTMILTNIAIVREKEIGTFEMLISAPVTRSEVIFGKTLPYVVIGMSNLPLILAVAVFVFRVPMRGSFLVLVGASFAFVCTTVAIGTLISTFCQNQQQASMAGFLFMFPAMMFSGLFFPIENIPAGIRWLATLDPLAHYLGLLRNILLKGGDARYVGTHVAILAVMAVVSVIASFRRFRTTLQ